MVEPEPKPPLRLQVALQIKPEVRELLNELRTQITSIEQHLHGIKESLSQGLQQFFEVQEEPPGLGEAVIGELGSSPANAGD